MRTKGSGPLLGVALLTVGAACFGEPRLSSLGPYAVYEIISLDTVTPTVTTPATRTVEVVATIDRLCDAYLIEHSLTGSGRDLTLQMEGRPDGFCFRGTVPAYRTYRATIADLDRGALRLRVVHRHAGAPIGPDTVVDVQLTVP